ncbi:restriction endonuclease subunit S [Ligilactobacillus salivarius]|uniref:restriction endonuclease subunit S n=1 Tax=Ligilactobacillus salivarius TaxID=1624 RepID=UPI001CDC7827|nr:restriction endonuclease subunit S [Ligilactobacillus salivarius]
MAKEEKKAPKLRFNGYTNDWEHVKSRYLFKNISSKGFQNLPVLSVTQDKGVIYRDSLDIDIKYDSSTLKNYKLVQPGDFIISLRSFQGGFETSYLTGITSPAYTIFNFIDNQSQNHMFWQYLFKRKNFINSLKKVTFGIRDGKAISFSQFGDVKVEYPDFDEQKHIAITLNKIDDTIQLHERKCEELTLIKKSLLQKLFPKEDKIKPEIRYKNFSDAWEQRKLGEVATFINGRAYKQNELLDSGKYKVLRVGNFYTNDSWYYSNLELADKYYIDEGDLVYTWSATFGPHIWNGEKVIYHYHIWKIELSKFLDRDFTLQILEADKAKLLANTNGSTMIHVTKKDMESKVISLPNIEEQKKIGSYLMKFDSLITLHQRKLEKLKQLKKFLLQNMFI